MRGSPEKSKLPPEMGDTFGLALARKTGAAAVFEVLGLPPGRELLTLLDMVRDYLG